MEIRREHLKGSFRQPLFNVVVVGRSGNNLFSVLPREDMEVPAPLTMLCAGLEWMIFKANPLLCLFSQLVNLSQRTSISDDESVLNVKISEQQNTKMISYFTTIRKYAHNAILIFFIPFSGGPINPWR